jgi:phage tail sheath gpL-like
MTISQPDITLNIVPAQRDVGNTAHRVLLIGQKVSGGTASSGVITTDVGNDNEADTLFGATSHLASMVRQFRRINPITPLDCIAYSDASGTNATGEIELTGTATAAGTILLTLGSNYDEKYSIAVAVGDTATEVGDAIDTAVAAATKSQFTTSNTTGTVTITHVHDGTIGNNLPLAVSGVPAGLTATLTGMASGATDPTITGLGDLLDGVRYHTIVYPGTWATVTIDTIMDGRLNATNEILDGVVIMTKQDSYANLQTVAASLNQPLLTFIGNKLVSDTSRLVGGAIVEMGDNISAQLAAIRSLRLTPEANISRYVIGNNGPRDVFGGPHLASLPYFNTPFSYLPVVKTGDGFTRTEIETLQTKSVSVLGNNVARNSIILGELVTTYTTDAGGNADTSFKYVNYIDTISNVREYMFNNLRTQYAQCRLTDGALVPGYNMANADSIKAYLVGLYLDLSGEGYVLTRAGETNLAYFKENLSVSLDLSLGKVTVDMIVPIVVQLRTILATVRVAFNTNG